MREKSMKRILLFLALLGFLRGRTTFSQQDSLGIDTGEASQLGSGLSLDLSKVTKAEALLNAILESEPQKRSQHLNN